MNPGMACIACHVSQEGSKIVNIGGTVYKTVHEPDLCYGAAGSGATVVITDANNVSTTLTINSSGNFSSRKSFAFPIHAKVVAADGTENAMSAAITTGDCNSCHTEQGENGAPGRIHLP